MRISEDGKRGIMPQQLRIISSTFPDITAGEMENMLKAGKDVKSDKLGNVNNKGHKNEN